MHTITALKSKSADGGGGPIPDYLTVSQYYLDAKGQERAAAAWGGKGAVSLGLSGSVTVDQMNQLAMGFAPDGTKLRQNAGAKPEKKPVLDREGNQRLDKAGKPMLMTNGVRIGQDHTWSAPKSVSVAAAGADPELRDAIYAVHHTAVDAAMDFLEAHAMETRRGKGGKDVIKAEMVYSRHTHFGARPHEKDWKKLGEHDMDVDPQLHTHCLVFNVCRGEDGQWGTVEPRELWRWKMAAGALYRAELARGLAGLGFGIEDDIRLGQDGEVKDRFFKLAGIPDDLVEQMSGRRKEILDHMAKNGGSAQSANLATRKSKDEPTFAELTERWSDDLDTYRKEHPGKLPKTMRELLGRKPELSKDAKRAQHEIDQEILAELHETKSVWTRADLTTKLAERNVGKLDMRGVLKETSAFLVRNDLALIQPEKIHKDDKGKKLSRRHTEVRFADPKVIEDEKRLVSGAVARKNELAVRVRRGIVEQAIKDMEKERGFALSPEQKKAVFYTTAESGGVVIVQGRAGTGKTTVSDAVVKAFREDGREIIGCATGWDAAKKLEAESGIPSHSIASLLSKLDRGKMQLSSKHVLIVDEAGMIGTPSLVRLMDRAHKANAKIILQGDVLQLQSVERGAPMRALAKEIGSIELTSIRRQKSQVDRDTADLFYAAGDSTLRSRRKNVEAGEKILAKMESRGQLQGYDDRQQAMETLISDYMTSARPSREKMIIAGSRIDVDALNQAVRHERKKLGELGTEFQVPTTSPRSGHVHPTPLSQGDEIRFTKKNDVLDVVNGSRGKIIGLAPIGDGHFQLDVKIESDIKKQDGRTIHFSTKDFACLDQAYAGTVHKSQGQGKEEIYHLFHAGMTDRQLSLVAFTRMKSSYAMYGGPEIFERSIGGKLTEDRLQMNALEEGLSVKFGGRTTKQVMADIAKEKAQKQEQERSAGKNPPNTLEPQKRTASKLSPTAHFTDPHTPTKPQKPTLAKPSRARKPVLTEAQTSLVQRAAKAIRQVADRVQQNRRKEAERIRTLAVKARKRTHVPDVGRPR